MGDIHCRRTRLSQLDGRALAGMARRETSMVLWIELIEDIIIEGLPKHDCDRAKIDVWHQMTKSKLKVS